MPVLIGLDEAGYGPTLGPLVVVASSFRFDEAPARDLWGLLRRSVARTPRGTDRRIPIADSKTIFSSAKGIGTLEEAVLAATLASPNDSEDLAGGLGLVPSEIDASYPWYRDVSVEVPIRADLLRVRPRAARLRRDLEDHGGAYLGARVIVVEAREFNRSVLENNNKSVLLFSVCSRLLAGWLRDFPDERVHITVDRHGGRRSYLPLLQRYLGEFRPVRMEDGPLRSSYRLADGRVDLSFEVRAEGGHLPVALASMVAKYVREIRMDLFNRYWKGRVGGLRPTSGYPVDARRFLRAIRPALRLLDIPRAHLVRSR